MLYVADILDGCNVVIKSTSNSFYNETISLVDLARKCYKERSSIVGFGHCCEGSVGYVIDKITIDTPLTSSVLNDINSLFNKLKEDPSQYGVISPKLLCKLSSLEVGSKLRVDYGNDSSVVFRKKTYDLWTGGLEEGLYKTEIAVSDMIKLCLTSTSTFFVIICLD